jgi:hypothetical protein
MPSQLGAALGCRWAREDKYHRGRVANLPCTLCRCLLTELRVLVYNYLVEGHVMSMTQNHFLKIENFIKTFEKNSHDITPHLG